MRICCLVLLFMFGAYIKLSAQIFSKPPEIKIPKLSREILQGDSLIIQWRVEKAKSFNFLNENRELPLSGKLVFRPDTTTTYRFLAKRNKHIKKKTIRIVVHPPTINMFSGPVEVSDEQDILLKWSTQYCDSLFIENIADNLKESGNIIIPADTSRSFKLVGINRFGIKTEKTLAVKVRYEESLDSNLSVMIGDTAWISWKFKNSKYVEIEGRNLKYNPVDKAEVFTRTACSLKLRVFKQNGDTLFYRSRIVVKRPRIIDFSGERSIFKGEEVELKWRTVNVEHVNLLGIQDSLPPVGKYTVKPDKSTEFKLKISYRGVEEEVIHRVKVFQRKFINDVATISDVKNNMRLDFEIFATDQSNYPVEMKLYILVVDTMGNFIQDLAPPFGTQATARKYFRSIVERFEKKDVKIRDFSVKEIREELSTPYDINLAMDYSGSMKGSIKKLEKAVKIFIQNKSKNDRLSITKFDHRLVTESPLFEDPEQILSRVKFKGLSDLGGFTALYAGADEGLLSLNDSSRNKQQILFTDGYENASLAHYAVREFTAQGLAKKACNQNVRMNIVTYGEGSNEPLLRYLSMLTGGNFYNIRKPRDIQNVLEELPRINKNYYIVSYKPYKKEGERSLCLEYYNNITKETEQREVYIGDDFDLSKFEFQNDSYWNNKGSQWGSLKPVSPPQVIAMFELDSYLLDEDDKKKIDIYIEFLQENENVKIKLFGHTDQSGNDLYCDNLSRKRAEEVKKYLLMKGILKERLLTVSCGKRYPVWKNEDKDWKSKENRRVELLLLR